MKSCEKPRQDELRVGGKWLLAALMHLLYVRALSEYVNLPRLARRFQASGSLYTRRARERGIVIGRRLTLA